MKNVLNERWGNQSSNARPCLDACIINIKVKKILKKLCLNI